VLKFNIISSESSPAATVNSVHHRDEINISHNAVDTTAAAASASTLQRDISRRCHLVVS